MWTTIPFIASSDREKSFAHPLISGTSEEKAAYWKALENRIERTSALPLQLLFRLNPYCDVGDPIYTISSLQTFIRLFPRANSISVFMRVSSSSHTIITKLTSIMNNASFSQANRAHTARLDVDDESFVQKILSAIPNVEVLQVRSINIDQWFLEAPTAGHHLRSLHLLSHWKDVPLAKLLDLLDRAPLLEAFKLDYVSIPRSAGIHHIVTHTRLSTLHFSFLNHAICDHLTLPALRSLSYEGSYHADYWPRPSDIAFLRRSGCMLLELSFRRCQVDEKHLEELLTFQKALITLRHEGGGNSGVIPTSILGLLSTKPDGLSERVSPALEVFSVVVLARQLKAVKRLIESRSAHQAKECGIATLREVAIQVITKQRDEDIKKDEHAALFKAFVNKGIGIRISYV